MIQALLPGETPPALVITGKARHKAAEKIRTVLDPMICPVHAMPATTRQLGRLALSNRIMAFSVGHQLSKTRLAALNELRTGMMVELRQVTKHRDPIAEHIQRPIILSTEKLQLIHEGQLEIVIDEAETMNRAHVFTALLTVAVLAIAEMQDRPVRVIELEREAPLMPPDDPEGQGPAP